MSPEKIAQALENVRNTTPLVHCITNYVTVNDCANALLACGGSPIMSDEPLDVVDITTICGGLVLNIGTLNASTIEGMRIAGARATELGHPIILDPVGAGASKLRTKTASDLLDTLNVTAVRGNMSEIKALSGASAKTRGVDVDPSDSVTDENLNESAEYAMKLAGKIDGVVAITGAIDIIANNSNAFAVRNGSPLMGRITGAGCMLTCVCGAFAVANPDHTLKAMTTAVAFHGLAGQVAEARMAKGDGTGTFRTYLIDALSNITPAELQTGANIEEI